MDAFVQAVSRMNAKAFIVYLPVFYLVANFLITMANNISITFSLVIKTNDVRSFFIESEPNCFIDVLFQAKVFTC